MQILYLGSFPASRMISLSNGKIDSLYRDDHALIKGLRSVKGVNVKVITLPDICSYPSNPIFFKGFYDEIDDVYSLPILNLSIIKLFWTVLVLFLSALKFVKGSPGQVIVITPYIVFHHILPSYLLKLTFRKRVKLVLVAPDIFFPKDWRNRILNKLSEKMAKKHDAFILYTEAMGEYLGVCNKPSIVIEGFNEIRPHDNTPNDNGFIVLYSGSLNLEYGVGRLVESMRFISEDDIKLHLLGDGNAVDFIKTSAENDPRIVYRGKLPKEQAMHALYEANVLVNPRNSCDGEYVAYSFPSKDIDYLGSGIPSILCKLPGMPHEYYSYFIDAGNGSPKELASAIAKVYYMKKEERMSLGESAKTFISRRMDLHSQGLRIVSMIEKTL